MYVHFGTILGNRLKCRWAAFGDDSLRIFSKEESKNVCITYKMKTITNMFKNMHLLWG